MLDQNCEARSHKTPVPAIRRVQVYDPIQEVPTLNRPGYFCEACIKFAEECGMEVKDA